MAMVSSPIFTSSPRKMSPLFCKSSTTSPPPPPLTLKVVRKQLILEDEELLAVPNMSKRKRPGRISIPVSGLGFEEVVKTTSDLDRLSEVEFEGEGYSVYCKRGRRGGVMEDRYGAVLRTECNEAFFGVFDGHGGVAAAEFAAKNLGNNIATEMSKRSEEDVEEAVKEGYLVTDCDFLKEDVRGGACSVTALIHEGNLVVSNAGDCRAVMSKGGVAEALTVDHRPSLDREKERIENSGGYVDCCNGVWRVHGSLAVSRAIGDRHLKQWVTAEPETKVFRIRPEFEFLILASDGLWDKVSNQEAVDVVWSLYVGVDKPEAKVACKKLVDLSIKRGSVDDISVMVIDLTRFIQ